MASRSGVPARHVDATELRRGAGFGVRAGDFALSLTWNKLDQVRLIRTPAASQYLDAMAAGEICMVPTLLAHCVLDDKMVLAFLTDPAWASPFTREERDAITRHIPWTRVVRPGKCIAPDGSMTDLMTYATEQQRHLVLKPSDRTRGEGVLIGPETTPATGSPNSTPLCAAENTSSRNSSPCRRSTCPSAIRPRSCA